MASQPLLFFPQGYDVHWRSWLTVCAQVVATARALRVLDLPAGAAVGYLDRCDPQAFAADLAIQAAGLLPCPLPPVELKPRNPEPDPEPEPDRSDLPSAGSIRPAAWLETWPLAPGEAKDPNHPAPDGLPQVLMPEVDKPWRPEPREIDDSILTEAVAGRVVVSGPQGRRVIDSGEVIAAGERLGLAIDLDLKPGTRPVVALAAGLSSRGARTVCAWALTVRAALLLEPTPKHLPGLAAWARPHVVASTVDTLDALGAQVAKAVEKRPGRPPWGRLSTVIVLDGETLPAQLVASWEHRGVRLLHCGTLSW